MTVIPILNNCEKMSKSPANNLYKSTCPVPPYKHNRKPNNYKQRSPTSVNNFMNRLINKIDGSKTKTSFNSVPNLSKSSKAMSKNGSW